MAIKLRTKIRQIVSKTINTTLGDLVFFVTYKRFTGTVRDLAEPSLLTPQFTIYTGIKAIVTPSVRGEAVGEAMLQLREGFQRSVNLLIAYDDLPFAPTVSDKPQTRDRFILEDLPYEWAVIEVQPGDPVQATYQLIGSRQVD